jgi:hypothetical protein
MCLCLCVGIPRRKAVKTIGKGYESDWNQITRDWKSLQGYGSDWSQITRDWKSLQGYGSDWSQVARDWKAL